MDSNPGASELEKWELVDSVLSGVVEAVAVMSSQTSSAAIWDVFPGCVAYKSGSTEIVIC